MPVHGLINFYTAIISICIHGIDGIGPQVLKNCAGALAISAAMPSF